MTVLSQAEYQAALRADFHTFVLRCFVELNPGAAFLPSWHIEVMAAKLGGMLMMRRRIRASRTACSHPALECYLGSPCRENPFPK
jgi:hypothetical protein